ncbi:PD-(D/E)XK nuclease family protein [Microcoleus sp. FACHB-1515]|uniref:PD-(D/E)XK nuclease family protein n=1 Tax=Cyanophyceae TaxID=3028117 RepID=UPI001683E96F|nr:PD-(D/E)XK nuclease family protein [Microcoleus sp. FACHB-1515]MBD2088677.1 PD-(D/E)XK nuclease family protein [Microcoleus sp. FACHB-1515]
MPDLLPALTAKSTRANGQTYIVDAQGVRLPSVTTILNATKPAADREALARWRQRVGSEQAKQISGTASRRGTQTHSHIRRYLLGDDRPCPPAALPYWNSLHPVLTQIDAVRLVEGFVFHYDLGYAGKVDCVASYQGTPCVCDWKTSDRPKQSIERLGDAPLQLAAYCGAINQVYDELDLDHALLAVAVADQPAEIFWLDADRLAAYWQQWQLRVKQFYRRRHGLARS